MNAKTLLTALATTAALAASSANAAVLLGGYHGGNESPNALQSAAPGVSNISVTLARSGLSTDITQGFSQISTAKWGTTTLDVAAPTGQLPAELAIFQGASTNAGDNTLTMTITNNGTVDLLLNAIHWNVKKDFNNVGPNEQSLTYISGDLADADATGTGNFTLANGTNGHDVVLSSFLTDTTLAAGESATFRWTHGAAQDPAPITGNTSLRMDNFAISGEVIPEPGSLALAGLGGLLIAARRRRA